MNWLKDRIYLFFPFVYGLLGGLVFWMINFAVRFDLRLFFKNNLTPYPYAKPLLIICLIFSLAIFLPQSIKRGAKEGYVRIGKIFLWPILLTLIGIFLRVLPTVGWYLFVILFSIGLSYVLINLFSFEKVLTKQFWQKYGIYIVSGIFFLIYFLFTLARHNRFDSHAFDLGIFDQAVWHLSRFEAPASTIRQISNLWGDHFHPILILAVPFYWIYNNARSLLFLQALALSAAAIPLYWLAKEKLKSNLAAILIAVSFLFFIGIQRALDFDFHEITLFPLFFLLSIWFLTQKKFLFYFIALILTLAVKEDTSIFMFFIGIWALVSIKPRWPGILTILLSISWYIIAVKFVIPAFSEGAGFAYFAFKGLGQNWGEVLKTIFARPWQIINVMLHPDLKQNSLLVLFSSFSFLPLISPAGILISLPMLGEQFLMDQSTHWEINFHYSVAIAPILALGAIWGIVNISRLSRKFKINKNKLILLLAILALAGSVFQALVNKPALLRLIKPSYWIQTVDIKANYKIISEIPKDASVWTQHGLVPHLDHRKEIYVLPQKQVWDAQYAVFSLIGSPWPFDEKGLSQFIISLLDNKDYGLIDQQGKAFLFKKGEKTSENLRSQSLEILKNYQ